MLCIAIAAFNEKHMDGIAEDVATRIVDMLSSRGCGYTAFTSDAVVTAATGAPKTSIAMRRIILNATIFFIKRYRLHHQVCNSVSLEARDRIFPPATEPS